MRGSQYIFRNVPNIVSPRTLLGPVAGLRAQVPCMRLKARSTVKFLSLAHLSVNEYPPMRVTRCHDWSWQLESMWVVMVSDHKAGPNPGRQAILDADAETGDEPVEIPAGTLLGFYHGHQVNVIMAIR